MRILLTGCSGFIARHLVPALLTRADEVVGVDRRPCTSEFGGAFSFVEADITDAAALRRVGSGFDSIVHLAAEHADFGITPEMYESVNVGGTGNLLELASETGIDDFVFTSSVAVYGHAPEPRSEETPPQPANPYGETKLGAEKLIREWCADGRRAVVIRPTVIHGPHNYANMFRLMTQIDKGRFVRVGAGDNVKSIGYVENLVDTVLFLMEHLGPGVSVFNFADEPQLTSHQIVATLAAGLDRPLPKVTIPKPLAVGMAFPLDVFSRLTGVNLPITAHRIHKLTSSSRYPADKLLREGFAPRYTSQDGLEKSAEWFRSLEDH